MLFSWIIIYNQEIYVNNKFNFISVAYPKGILLLLLLRSHVRFIIIFFLVDCICSFQVQKFHYVNFINTCMGKSSWLFKFLGIIAILQQTKEKMEKN